MMGEGTAEESETSIESSTTAEGSNTVQPVPDAVITVYVCS